MAEKTRAEPRDVPETPCPRPGGRDRILPEENCAGDMTAARQSELERLFQEQAADLAKARQALLDLTARNESLEKAFANSEERFRALTRHLPLVLFLTDARGASVYVNERWRESGLAGGVHPEDADRLYRTLQDAAAAGREWAAEFAIPLPSGGSLWVAARTAALRDERGEVTGYLATVANINDRKQAEAALKESEERYRLLTEYASDLIFRQSADGVLRDVSGASRALVGYEPGELVGRPQLDFVHESDRAVVRAYFERLLDGEAVNVLGYRFVHKQGHPVWLEARARPLEQPGAAGAEVVGVARDVTEARRAAEELRRLQAEATRANRLAALGELASGLAHELNQPLAAILAYAQGCARLIRAGSDDREEVLHALAQVAAQAEHAGEVVRRLRRFIARGEPQRAPAALNDLVREALALAEPDLRDHGVRPVMELADPSPTVCVDRVQIEQVLINLLRNAAEALAQTALDRRAVRVRTRADGAAAEVTVTDAGPGVAPEIAANLFEPFQTTKAQGLGLGLAISRTLAQAHGGQLSLAAGPGPGATFVLSLPLTPDPP